MVKKKYDGLINTLIEKFLESEKVSSELKFQLIEYIFTKENHEAPDSQVPHKINKHDIILNLPIFKKSITEI